MRYDLRKNGAITWVGDAHHKGTDVYWSDRLRQWVAVDLENLTVSTHERLVFYRCTGDAEPLNAVCVACDLDAGLWLVPDDVSGEVERVGLRTDNRG